ncbi:MAG: ribosomal protein [Chlamydiales bacterium]|jgi:large subunit ribosomal protein L32|nr:ribosomal protein [Chlamydiales bacterium]
MAVPRNRMSNARKNSRQAHSAKKPKNLVNCPSCKALKPSHASCISCGYYGKGLYTKGDAV